jgi:hypothetical protein
MVVGEEVPGPEVGDAEDVGEVVRRELQVD